MEIDAGKLDIDNSSERLFVFHESEISVSTLQHIASHTVALQLLHHYLSREKHASKMPVELWRVIETVVHLDLNFEKESKKLLESLKTPQCIEEMLKKSLVKICYETKRWIHHFSFQIFCDGTSRYCPRDFDLSLIVWCQNDEIDYKRSASNMLTDGKLNAEQKFVLMCSYGMATELEIFPINTLPEFFCLLGISDLKVAYWISYHRPDLHEMWLRMPEMIRNQDASINVTMAIECARQSLSYAFEYFWNRLNEEEQTSVIVRILPQCWKLLKIMLSTMPSFRQLQLVNQIPVALMSGFFIKNKLTQIYWPMPENVFIAYWTLVKDRITEQEFVKFLVNVCFDAMGCEEYMVTLIKVWDTASDRLKRHIVENRPDILFASFMRRFDYSPSSHKFFIKFLQLVNEDTRKELYLSLDVYDITSKYDIDILNLCLPEEADQLRLKNEIMDESRDMVKDCAMLMFHEKFDDVIARVTFFSRNAHEAREFFKKLLESRTVYGYLTSFFLKLESWNEVSNFIDTALTNDFSTISRLKKQLVRSISALNVSRWHKKEYFDVLVQITEQVFSPEEIKSFKQTLFKHFQKEISSPNRWSCFEGRCFNTFVSWCSSDENQIVDFKSIVPIDAFFNEIFRGICSSPDENPEKLLKKLDDFLKYVCVSDEKVELLKIRKFYERDQYWIREVERIFDSETQHTILDWFRSFGNSYDTQICHTILL
ncbi:uncharacterized protein LOC135841121 isoform X1 [Planococcus citri]|uniref:uncharacterized protein LOC135841121 isoform X1 n=1 Tax=Planococcus citri TaxID=170843 RepID=UPI0031F9C977